MFLNNAGDRHKESVYVYFLYYQVMIKLNGNIFSKHFVKTLGPPIEAKELSMSQTFFVPQECMVSLDKFYRDIAYLNHVETLCVINLYFLTFWMVFYLREYFDWELFVNKVVCIFRRGLMSVARYQVSFPKKTSKSVDSRN